MVSQYTYSIYGGLNKKEHSLYVNALFVFNKNILRCP